MIDVFIGWSQLLSMLTYASLMSLDFNFSYNAKKRFVIYVLSWLYVSVLLNLWVLGGVGWEDFGVKLFMSLGMAFVIWGMYISSRFCSVCTKPLMKSLFQKNRSCPKCGSPLDASDLEKKP
jgi:hypothetical protein